MKPGTIKTFSILHKILIRKECILMHNFILLIIIVFAIACLIVVCCLCIASTNWRDDRHDYELDDIRDKSDENK